jgi:ABC-2 type transport system ATP-binding protein
MNSPRSDLAIDVNGLSKTFTGTTKAGRFRRTQTETVAVDNISLQVAVGSFVAVIGPNGAGKSTTIKMLTGILAPTSGALRVLGHVPLDERTTLAARIGVVFGQRSQLWWDLPLEDSFSLLRHLYRIKQTDFDQTVAEFTDRFELGPLLKQPVRTLSLGQRMRAELTGVLLHRPELLFLDEPTIGLDVVSKFAMRDALRELHARDGVTVVLTTHDLSDVEELCERVVIIDHGHIIRDEPIAALMEQVEHGRASIAESAQSGGSDFDLEALVRQIYLG